MVLRPPDSFVCPKCVLTVYAFINLALPRTRYQCENEEEVHVFRWIPRSGLFRLNGEQYDVKNDHLELVSPCERCGLDVFVREEDEEDKSSRLKCTNCGQYTDVSVVRHEGQGNPQGGAGKTKKESSKNKGKRARRVSNGGSKSAISRNDTASVA